MDFENCEGVYLDQKEIIEMQIVFNKELCWGSGDYIRQVESGFLKVKLDPAQNEWRENSLFDNLEKGKKGNRQIERRLSGKRDLNYMTYVIYILSMVMWGQVFTKRMCRN